MRHPDREGNAEHATGRNGSGASSFGRMAPVSEAGISKISASGKVYGLNKLEDFNGNYTGVAARATVGGGGGVRRTACRCEGRAVEKRHGRAAGRTTRRTRLRCQARARATSSDRDVCRSDALAPRQARRSTSGCHSALGPEVRLLRLSRAPVRTTTK